MTKAVLVLKDGTYFVGESFGLEGETFGEVVFNTSMTGYQEITTDASYNGQIVCMTYPLIGNYGMNQDDVESYRTHVEGFIVKELCDYHSNFRATMDPDHYFKKNNIIGIKGIDTRALTQHIRQFGSMEGVISTSCGNINTLLEKLENYTSVKRDLVEEVTIKHPYVFEGSTKKVCLLDFGVKSNIIRSLKKRDCEIIVLPAYTDYKEILEYDPDGIVLSNGPGDPRDLPEIIANVKQLVKTRTPILGICLGHQLLSLAVGLEIYKLKFGHHGGNHAVKDLNTGKCYITSQNHNYAVKNDNIPEGIKITHFNVNDGTVEGFSHVEYNLLSIQYHPEAAPGPKDSAYIFDDFLKMMER
ncbi:MAG: glutamine-hydrolyzing carbamoyl-phosphate synthase small subunit [Clostridia bacterium]|nr:glutamine-hydrolyzing carbamoyl-phosphate synthase small subunit [Clostridia bacterium]